MVRLSPAILAAIVAVAAGIQLTFCSYADAQVTIVRSASQEVVDALRRYLAGSARQLDDAVDSLGGTAILREAAQRALREGGDEGLVILIRAVESHGPDAVRAASNAVDIPTLFRAVGELPAGMSGPALRRLGAGREGRVLAEIVHSHGSAALRAEVLHSGVGARLVAQLGDEGAEIAARISSREAMTLARHGDDLARLPESARAGVLSLLRNDTERMLAFMGRFIEDNPGKVLFTAAAAAIIFDNSEQIFGGGGEIVFGPDGTPRYVARPGMIERTAIGAVRAVAPWVALVAGGLLVTRLVLAYALRRRRHNLRPG